MAFFRLHSSLLSFSLLFSPSPPVLLFSPAPAQRGLTPLGLVHHCCTRALTLHSLRAIRQMSQRPLRTANYWWPGLCLRHALLRRVPPPRIAPQRVLSFGRSESDPAGSTPWEFSSSTRALLERASSSANQKTSRTPSVRCWLDASRGVEEAHAAARVRHVTAPGTRRWRSCNFDLRSRLKTRCDEFFVDSCGIQWSWSRL